MFDREYFDRVLNEQFMSIGQSVTVKIGLRAVAFLRSFRSSRRTLRMSYSRCTLPEKCRAGHRRCRPRSDGRSIRWRCHTRTSSGRN